MALITLARRGALADWNQISDIATISSSSSSSSSTSTSTSTSSINCYALIFGRGAFAGVVCIPDDYAITPSAALITVLKMQKIPIKPIILHDSNTAIIFIL